MTIGRNELEYLALALYQTKPVGVGTTHHHMQQWTEDCAAIAVALSKLNPSFKPDRFEAACNGVPRYG